METLHRVVMRLQCATQGSSANAVGVLARMADGLAHVAERNVISGLKVESGLRTVFRWRDVLYIFDGRSKVRRWHGLGVEDRESVRVFWN